MQDNQETISFGVAIIIFFALFGAFFGIFFLPGNIIQNMFFQSCTIGYGHEPDMTIPLPVNVSIIIIGLAISWFLATKSENMRTINGIGTKLVGNEKSLKGFIATKWLVVLFLPIIPIKSYEVFEEQQGIRIGLHQRVYYSLHPLPKLAINQIKKTYQNYFLWYLLMALVILGLTVLGTMKCF